MQNIGVTLQQDILGKVGIGEAHFMKYQMELGAFMNELMMNGMQAPPAEKPMSLGDVKNCLRMQIEYLKKNGLELIDRVMEASKGWGTAKKSMLPTLLSLIVADETFEDHPEIDEEQLQSAESMIIFYRSSLPKSSHD